jgi:hypothetical protein
MCEKIGGLACGLSASLTVNYFTLPGYSLLPLQRPRATTMEHRRYRIRHNRGTQLPTAPPPPPMPPFGLLASPQPDPYSITIMPREGYLSDFSNSRCDNAATVPPGLGNDELGPVLFRLELANDPVVNDSSRQLSNLARPT